MTGPAVYAEQIQRIYDAFIIVNLRREALPELVGRYYPLAPDESRAAILAGLEQLWERDRRGGRAPDPTPAASAAGDPRRADVDRLR
jgi:hypothetical protein